MYEKCLKSTIKTQDDAIDTVLVSLLYFAQISRINMVIPPLTMLNLWKNPVTLKLMETSDLTYNTFLS